MKSTLADNKQLFNVKALASGVALNALQEGQFGIFPAAGGVSVLSTATFADLPEEFFFVSKLNGKIYYSFDNIKKANLIQKAKAPYKAGQINIIKATIESCTCVDFATLTVNVGEAGLEMRDGLTWQHRDSYTVSKPEFDCACANGEAGDVVRENNIFTKLLVEKIVQANSEYYTAEMQTPAGTVVELADFEAFLEDNLDEVDGAKELLSVVIKGKDFGRKVFNDHEVNYIYARGVKLDAGLTFDNKVVTPFSVQDTSSYAVFTQVQPLGYEVGAGSDVRAEEWDLMGYYTNTISRLLSCGALHPDVVYQFENGKNYSTVNFEFWTDKTERNNGDKRLFGVSLITETPAIYAQLATIFGV